MARRPLFGLVLLLAATSFAVTGCGSSKNKAFAGSKAAFAKEMNSLCSSANTQLATIGATKSVTDLATNGSSAADIVKQTIDKLKKLEPPASIKTPVGDWIVQAESELSDLNSAVDAAKKKDTAAYTTIVNADTAATTKAIDADSTAIGAPACDSSGFGAAASPAGSKPLEKSDYVKRMVTIGKDLSTSLNGVAAATTAKEAAAELVKAQVALRSAVKELNAIVPPTDIKTQHANLAAAVAEFADELNPVVKKLQAGKIQALATVSTLKGLTAIRNASSAITKAGYKIGG